MRVPRVVSSLSTICVVFGVLGGLGLGYMLSRNDGWLTPLPWSVYVVVLLAVIAVASWIDYRARERALRGDWPLPAGFDVPDDEVTPNPIPITAATAMDAHEINGMIAPDTAATSEGPGRTREHEVVEE